MSLQFAHLSLPKPGERMNGDAVFLRRDEAGRVLFAVIDGLGHGPIAAEASQAAVSFLEKVVLTSSVLETMQLLHERLRGTRGAAATICMVRGNQLEACAVGNVQLMCANSSVPLVLSAGVLGMRVAKFRVCECVLRAKTRIALLSDGISNNFRLDDTKHLAPQQACKAIFDRHRRAEDDATILIADMEQ